MCLSYAKGIYHINIEFILNGSKISLSSKEHKQTTISNVLYKTIAVLHDFTKKQLKPTQNEIWKQKCFWSLRSTYKFGRFKTKSKAYYANIASIIGNKIWKQKGLLNSVYKVEATVSSLGSRTHMAPHNTSIIQKSGVMRDLFCATMYNVTDFPQIHMIFITIQRKRNLSMK